jgi:hypothetical protein
MGRNTTRRFRETVDRRGLSGPAARHRHGVEGNCAQPNGGGAALRLLVVNVGALRDATPAERTSHETAEDGPMGRAIHEHALDDLHPIPTSIADILPISAILAPQSAAGFRPSVCLLPDRGRPEVSHCFGRRFASAKSLRTRRRFRSTTNVQAINSRSHPPMSVKRKLFSDVRGGMPCAIKKT